MSTSLQSTLTDGTGVSPLRVPKVLKDFIVDFTKALGAVLIGSNIASAQSALDNPHAVLIAVIGAFFGTLYRFILSWDNTTVVGTTLSLLLILSMAFPASALGFGGQGPAHSGRCRGVPRPPMLGVLGNWTCTRDGWRHTFGTPHVGSVAPKREQHPS